MWKDNRRKKEKDSKKKKAVLCVSAEWRLKLGFGNESFTIGVKYY